MKYFQILFLVLLTISCKNNSQEVSEPEKKEGITTITQEQFQAMEMQVGSPVMQPFDVTVKTSGRIDVPPQNKVKITSYSSGFIKSAKLLVGDKVSKGQALITLASTEIVDIQKEYLEVAEQIKFLKSEFDRQKILFDEKITSQKNYLKAESEYKSARGKYQTLRAKLQMFNINPTNVERGNIVSTITLFSPISGDVTVANAAVGMAVNPTDVLLEIVNNNNIHLEMSVFEKDILKVKENQLIKFKIPETSNEIFEGKVHLIGKSIEGTDRTTNVHGHLDEKVKQRLLTGMFIDANIVVDSKTGLAIPKDAVISENGKNYVFVLKNQNNKTYDFRKTPIQIGEKSDTFIEIIPTNQINEKTKIVTRGAFDISE